jgi:predicted nucleic acid-binding protein
MQGEEGSDVELVDRALADCSLVLAPASLSELLSDPLLTPSLEKFILGIQQLEIKAGYWGRTGKLRAELMRRGHRPKIADTLIAQSCLDHQVPLITRDRDFSAFRDLAGLRLL